MWQSQVNLNWKERLWGRSGQNNPELETEMGLLTPLDSWGSTLPKIGGGGLRDQTLVCFESESSQGL